MQKNRPPGKRMVKAGEVDDGGRLRHNFIDYLWRHMKQGEDKTLEELFCNVNASYVEKQHTPMGWGRFVSIMRELDKKGFIKTAIVDGSKIIFLPVRKPTPDEYYLES